jgi:Na+/phosphate symporter
VATTEPTGAGDYPPPRARTGSARTLTIVGFVLAGIAVLFAPPVFGLAAVVLGIIAHTKGDPLGKWAIVAGIAGAIVGMVLVGLLMSAADDADAMALLRR